MAAKIHVGCCGWSYLIEEHFSNLYTRSFTSKLQAYAQIFRMVEINSTYYGIQRTATARKWHVEATAVDPEFEFTVKAYQGITHSNRFSKKAIPFYNKLAAVTDEVRGKIILFQSPANFQPTAANISKMRDFFTSINREGRTFVWEPRGTWYDDPSVIVDVCTELNLIHCVDPFRNEPLVFGNRKMTYFRIHGFGVKSMYHYNFSKEELSWLLGVVRELSPTLNDIYVLFNNQWCYENGRMFREMINGI